MSENKIEQHETEWLDKALECYDAEKSKNPYYISFDDTTVKIFARRIVGQIKTQMKLDNNQCELLLNAIFGGNYEINKLGK